jgi:hypothetical protein
MGLSDLNALLVEKKSAIVKKWFGLIIDNYPADTSHFLKKQKDCFLNPVGYTISQSTDGIFNELLGGQLSEKMHLLLDDIIKIKAVQDFSASQAISFIFLLKSAIREVLEHEIEKNRLSEELRLFESKIDQLALLSFDKYMKCKEKIFDIRVNEIRNMTFQLLKRANLVCEIDEEEPDVGAESLVNQKIKG